MRTAARRTYTVLALTVVAAVACSTTAPKNSPEGGLWVANNTFDTIPDFSANQLDSSGQVEPAIRLITAVSGPAGLALDASGNMWESSYNSDSLVMFSPAARNARGASAPTTVIVSSALLSAENLAFDAQGNLWVANCNGGNLLAYTPAQQTAGGTQTPAVAISGGSVVKCPYSMAFDGSGNVWVADIQHNHIVKYSAASLAASGTPTPADTIGANAGSLNHTAAVVFDSHGNLWVASYESGTVVAYTPAQLGAGGTPLPNITIALPNATNPFGLAFDKVGSLWVSDVNRGRMLAYTSSQLSASGSPIPSVTLSTTFQFFEPEQPLIDPYATATGVAALRVSHDDPASANTVHLPRQASRFQF
jgi:streptogramin lyase